MSLSSHLSDDRTGRVLVQRQVLFSRDNPYNQMQVIEITQQTCIYSFLCRIKLDHALPKAFQ